MKTLAIAALLLSMTGTAALADSCAANADAKKLAGAARTSSIAKCQKDARSACDAQAAEKKLHGAAQASFVSKCVKDAIGQ